MTREEAWQWLRDVVKRELTGVRADVKRELTAAKVIEDALDDAERVEWMQERLANGDQVNMQAEVLEDRNTLRVWCDTLRGNGYNGDSVRAAIDAARGKA